MQRYLITFSYDGSNYEGFQKQPGKKTIQGELERVLMRINNNKRVIVCGSGRTDSGVHALGQTAHFDLDINITCYKLKSAINSYLDNDIYIKKAEDVAIDFHARYNVRKKEYIYKINMGEYNPIARNSIYQYNRELNLKVIKQALKRLEGKHDFKNFTSEKDLTENSIREIIKTKLIIKDDILTLVFLGKGFLKYQIRYMVGTLIEVGEGKIKSIDIVNILRNKDTGYKLKKANASGLYLNKVIY